MATRSNHRDQKAEYMTARQHRKTTLQSGKGPYMTVQQQMLGARQPSAGFLCRGWSSLSSTFLSSILVATELCTPSMLIETMLA